MLTWLIGRDSRKTISGQTDSKFFATLVILAVVLVFLFVSVAQAQTESAIPTFDHAKTGFLLRDIHTTLMCEQCHVNGIFKNTPKDCAGCHSIGSRVGATAKPINHVQTVDACETCHASATSFLVKSFKHVGISTRCLSCHNNQSLGVMSKSANHFPTLLPCESCHTNTNTFASATMDHTGITSACASCHSGQFVGVVSKPVMHISTTASCESCHSNTSTFLGAYYNHSGVAAGSCDSCHNGAFPGVMGKPVNHIATNGAKCDTCHTQTNTINFTTFLGASFNHTGVVGSCSSCHNGAYPGVLGKPSNHIPTTAACDSCHTQANTSNYSTFLNAVYNHSGASGICSTCHNGSYTNVTAKSSGHIATTAQCDTCHTQKLSLNFTTFLGALYNHAGVLPGSCATCHDGVKALGKPVIHVTTTLACDQCHTQSNTSNFTTFFGASNPHTTPSFNVGLATCSTCHNGSQAVGLPTNHIPTSGANCGTCHTAANTSNYATFLGAAYAHTGVVAGSCATCHSGSYPGVLGKTATHVATTAACDTCHTQTNTSNFTTFLGAAYNHTGVASGSCATCHNGVQAKGKSATHLATTAACDTCHTQSNTSNYTTFFGAGIAHTASMAGTCQTCHNGSAAKGLSVGHIPTGALSCDGCHKIYSAPAVITFFPGTMNHLQTASSRCDTCHNGSYTTQGTSGGAQAKVSTHIPTTITGALDCNTCHRITLGSTVASMSWLTERMNHNGAQGGGAPIYCITCHLRGNSYLGSMQKLSHNGASTAKDCSKSGCHKPLGSTGVSYSTWK